MRLGPTIATLALLASTGCPRGAGVPVVPPPRRTTIAELGPGDMLEITVRGHEDISGPYQVADNGTIRFPHLGEVQIQGQKRRQIEDDITERLADGWLRDPQVDVQVTERQNREVSVLGQVKEPGSLPFKERLTLVQAISEAGGMNPLAMPRRVKLIRETDKGKQTFEIDVTQILEARAEDLPLAPGDIVFVPESPI